MDNKEMRRDLLEAIALIGGVRAALGGEEEDTEVPGNDSDFEWRLDGHRHVADELAPTHRIWVPVPPGEWSGYQRAIEVFIPSWSLIGDNDKIAVAWDAIGASNRDGLLSYTVLSKKLLKHVHGVGGRSSEGEKTIDTARISLPDNKWLMFVSGYYAADGKVSTVVFDTETGATLASVLGGPNVSSFKTGKTGIAIDLGLDSEVGNPNEVDMPGMAWRNLSVSLWK